MTLETCKKRYELAKEAGNEEEMAMWKARAEKKIARWPQYKGVDINELLGLGGKSGKKPKG